MTAATTNHPLLLGGDGGWTREPFKEVCCPFCADTFVHPGGMSFVPGHDRGAADWGGRGDLRTIRCYGECGSEFEVCLGFHKGNLLIFTRAVRDCRQVAPDFPPPPAGPRPPDSFFHAVERQHTERQRTPGGRGT